MIQHLDKEVIEKFLDIGQIQSPQFDHPQGGMGLIVPEGYAVQHIPPLDKPLTRIKEAPVFLALESFAEYVNDFKDTDTRIFAATTPSPAILAVLDYHRGVDGDKGPVPDYGAHRATFVPQPSPQWTRWTSIDGKLLPQRDFAEFIEENLVDVVRPMDGNTPVPGYPYPADLLEIVKTLKVTKQVEIESAANLANGFVQIKYHEEGSAASKKGAIEVPTKICLGIPVFFGETPYRVECFLRYRAGTPDEGGLKFQIKIDRREQTLLDAFGQQVASAGVQTDIKPLWGKV